MQSIYSKTILKLSAAEFDLIRKAVIKFGSQKIRIEDSYLILRDDINEVAVVDLTLCLGREVSENICFHLPKHRMNILNPAKTNSDVAIIDIDKNHTAITVGDFSGGYRKNIQNGSIEISPNPLLAVAVTDCHNLCLHRKLLNSLSKNSKSSMYVHSKKCKIVSVGTAEGAIDFDTDLSWDEEIDIIVNADVKLAFDWPETYLSIVREGRKYYVLFEYVLDEDFKICHYVKTN